MGGAASLKTEIEGATPEQLKEVAAKIKPEDLEKLKKAFDDSAAPAAAAPSWKIESAPDGGILLCGHPGSGNVISPMLFCGTHLKEEQYKFQMCDIMKGEQLAKDFLDVNPFHQVPSAKMGDGTCLYESSAMLRYLALKYAPETYPEDKQLIIDIAMDKRQSDLYKAWGPIGYYAMQIAPAPPKDAAKKLNQVLALMDKAFLGEGKKFIGGDKACIADYSILPLINTLTLPAVKKTGYKLPERWVKYVDDAKSELSAFKKSVEIHEGWVASNEDKIEDAGFDADEDVPGASGEWKIEEVPADGVLVCGHPGSGNVVSVTLFTNSQMKEEKRKFQMCDIMKGEQMGQDFLDMNPFHQVPSGKMSDGTCLFETCAMLRYLAKKFAPELYPEDKRLLIDMCMDKRQTDFYKAWSPIGYYAMQIAPKPEKDAGKKLTEVLSTMEKAFLTGKFVTGDKLSVADFAIVPFLFTLTLPAVEKTGYKLPARWATYVQDVKGVIGDAAWKSSTEVHEGWVGSNLEKVEDCAFEQ